MQVTIHAAKTQLSKLIQAALAGEEVIIANGDTPVVKLVPLSRGSYKLGGLEGKVAPPPDEFFEPMSEPELAEWE
jgi:antitoxin (DNA-binding transcriptional repressor) of toxin-antitoxin stability system